MKEKLAYIFMHPIHNWFNEKTLLAMGITPILWLLAVSYFITYCRDYHFDKDHGVVEWENIKMADKNCVIRV